MSLKKHYCDFYHFALLLVYLCEWCRVFFYFSLGYGLTQASFTQDPVLRLISSLKDVCFIFLFICFVYMLLQVEDLQTICTL